jgi:archaemetzincin
MKELQLIAVGDITIQFLKELETPIQQVLGVTASPGKGLMATPTFAFNKDREQYHTTAIMRRLLPMKEAGVLLVLGITDVDLFQPDSNFVYGEADRESHVSVMSIYRLRGEGESWKRRTFVEAVHQTGHLLGLSYCEDPRCAMYLATTITDAERRQLHLCNTCRSELIKIRR